MNTELLGSIAQIVLMVVLAYPLGKYIAKVYKGRRPAWTSSPRWKDGFLNCVASTRTWK